MLLMTHMRKYITCILSLLLLIIIIVSKNLISDEIQFYFLLIIILLIIITCFLDNIQFPSWLKEDFTTSNMNMVDKTRNCVERSKEHQKYNHKIDSRLNDLRKIEEQDRKIKEYEDEHLKLKEFSDMNNDYLANGESF